MARAGPLTGPDDRPPVVKRATFRRQDGKDARESAYSDDRAQECSGGSEEDIYARADRVVQEASRSAEALDLHSPDGYPQVLQHLRELARRLAREAFHDGCYGPGTASIPPEACLERIREAYAFREIESTLTGPALDRITRVYELAKEAEFATADVHEDVGGDLARARPLPQFLQMFREKQSKDPATSLQSKTL